ncbi:hypothetical protein BEI_1398 [Halomonas beimenensis]|uniref:Uncharacterized protein n=1 Tax=Halomonas beimenensis TaxID=475662 RepID=A0A291P677_9GAMM|nr:hypothetical protein BEI_1398 [Halomonas beimenensis]
MARSRLKRSFNGSTGVPMMPVVHPDPSIRPGSDANRSMTCINRQGDVETVQSP